jgi:alpha-galactosidase
MLADLTRRGLCLDCIEPLVDGRVPTIVDRQEFQNGYCWSIGGGGAVTLSIAVEGDLTRLRIKLDGADTKPLSLGIRFGEIAGVRAYLRNGYQSWDGSFFVAPGTPEGDGPPGKSPTLGFATTALLPKGGPGAVLLGFERHDRFQTRFHFRGTADLLTIDAETVLDCTGAVEGEALLLFDGDEVEETLRRWSILVARSSPLPPRVKSPRITGWCSWYSLYAAIDEASILEHLRAAQAFRDGRNVPLEVFQIDDGFTPEMGDWLRVKPQFPRGMEPLIADIREAGFRPGLWIAPFMVGNRSELYAEHPDWVVKDRESGGPLIQMRFYGEFRWHKRSEEYYILDITHPGAEAYIRSVFRTWSREWGASYFKTDFMLFGSEHGPERAQWYRPALSRIAIWRLMAALIREEIGEDALWLGCGCPLWASIGFVDAIRIGRDIGVEWHGEYSAESLLRDQLTRNHASGILWQADPDCILLRENFHHLTDEEVHSLAWFAGLSGGVLMTSDKLDALPATRAELFAHLLTLPVEGCRFPQLAESSGVITQLVNLAEGQTITNVFNVSDNEAVIDGVTLAPHSSHLKEGSDGDWPR